MRVYANLINDERILGVKYWDKNLHVYCYYYRIDSTKCRKLEYSDVTNKLIDEAIIDTSEICKGYDYPENTDFTGIWFEMLGNDIGYTPIYYKKNKKHKIHSIIQKFPDGNYMIYTRKDSITVYKNEYDEKGNLINFATIPCDWLENSRTVDEAFEKYINKYGFEDVRAWEE